MSNAQDRQYDFISSLFNKTGNGSGFSDWLRQPANWGGNGKPGRLFTDGFNQNLYDTYNGMWNKNNPLAMASQPPAVATAPNVMPQQQNSQMDLLNTLNTAIGNMDNRANEQYENSNRMRSQSNDQWMQIMQKLMNKEDDLSSGNPFIDMLQGYTRYKQRSNPNYQFGGLMSLFKRKPNNVSFQQQQYDDSNNIG